MGGDSLTPLSPAEPAVWQLDGAVDVWVAKRLLETARALAKNGGALLVDCSAVTRLDASAVQILLALKTRVEGSEEAFVLRSVPEQVLTLLQVTGAARALAIDPSVAPETPPGPPGDPAATTAAIEGSDEVLADDDEDDEPAPDSEPVDVEAVFAGDTRG